MSDPADLSLPPFRNGEAPFIYFDIAPTFGTLMGAVQIELAARILTPTPDGGVHAEFVPTARLRCSPAAALDLKNALGKALGMFQGPPPEGESTGSTKH